MSNVLEPHRPIDPEPDEKATPFHDDILLDDLPASYRVDKVDIQLPRFGNPFFSQELDVKRLHRIMHWLWLCGQTAPPRPLHHQLLMDRRIVVTERLDFHLVWGDDRMFVKPLPRWLIRRDFWELQLDDEDEDKDPQMGASSGSGAGGPIRTVKSVALGFLLSYVALIQHESDFEIAMETRLIPKELTWSKWKVLVREILDGRRERLHRQVADRFIYGELRLHRLNLIYQCLGRPKGYIPRWNSYKGFIQDNLDVVVAGTVYVVLVLTAMQVGLATTVLEGNTSFEYAAYGTAVFAMLGPLVAVAFVLLFSMVDFCRNWAWNRRNEKKTQNKLGRTWK